MKTFLRDLLIEALVRLLSYSKISSEVTIIPYSIEVYSGKYKCFTEELKGMLSRHYWKLISFEIKLFYQKVPLDYTIDMTFEQFCHRTELETKILREEMKDL